MKRAALCVAVAVAALSVAGCGKPTAEKRVLATVGGEKITFGELDTELKAGGVAEADDPNVRKAALDGIVARKLLAHAARDAKLDKAPEAQVMREAAAESFDAALQRRIIVDKVPKPTPAEAAAFIQAHPEMFAQRTGYLLDQLHVKAQSDPGLAQALRPAMNLPDVEKVLQARNIPYRRSVEQLDTLRAAPQLTAAIQKLSPGEPFVLPEPGGFTVSQIKDSRVEPITGAQATAIATELVLAQNRAKALSDWIAAQQKTKVEYANGPGAAKK